MASKKLLPAWAEATIACGLVGAASFFGVTWMLGSGVIGNALEEEPVVLDASILEEPNDYIADIRAAAQFARERWSYAEHRKALDGVDLDANEAQALAILGDQPDAARFHQAITFFVSGLHDGHAGVIHAEFISPGRHRWPFELVEVQEGIMLNAVHEDASQLQRGDLLLAIDGIPIEEWIQEAEHRVFSSTDSSRRQRAIHDLARWDDAETRSFSIRRVEAEELEVELTLIPSFEKVPTRPWIGEDREHRMLEDKVAYFRPSNFSPPAHEDWSSAPEKRDEILAATYAEFDGVMGELAEARALILDLRSNPGGTDLLGQFLVDRLVEGEYTYFQLSALGKDGWRDFHALKSSAPEGVNTFAGKPLAVLLDDFTFSTADNVAAALEAVHPNAVFVGRPNGAGTGAPRPIELPRTKTKIYFCTQRVKTPSGRMGEGISVQLDRPVQWTREDVLQGRDPDLAAAIELLQN